MDIKLSFSSRPTTYPSGIAPTLKSWMLALAVVASLAGCDKGDSQPPTAAAPASPPPAPTVTPSQTKPDATSITPVRAAVTSSQKQQFSATIAGRADATVTWEVDGVPGGNTMVGTINASGLYTPPGAGGAHTITARATDGAAVASASVAVTDLGGIYTGRYDSQRTGQNRKEYALTPATLNVSTFGKLFSCPVDGEVYAQPLYATNLPMPDGIRNVVVVATQNNSVYAFDADRSPCHLYWHKNYLQKERFLNILPGGVATADPKETISQSDYRAGIGITGTPVIDPATNTVYFVTKTRERNSLLERVYDNVMRTQDRRRHQLRLHALSLIDSSQKFNGPAEMTAALTVAGKGENELTCPSPDGRVSFCPKRENQRSPLLLVDGKVYVPYSMQGDAGAAHGWMIGYNAANLAEVPIVYNVTPNGRGGGFWWAAADTGGYLYGVSGNGTFDEKAPRTDFGNSFVKLKAAGEALTVVDFFTPFNQDDLNPPDLDLGSGGPLVLPDSVGSSAHPHLIVGGDKSGQLYLVDRDNMGGYCAGCTSNANIVQQLDVSVEPPCIVCGIFTTPAVWEGRLYVHAIRDALKAYSIVNARISEKPVSVSPHVFAFPGAMPVVSSQGATNGIVWVIDASGHGTKTPTFFHDMKPTPWPPGESGPAVLHAYDALNLEKELWNSSQGENKRDQAGHAIKFSVPTIANGKAYVGTQTELTVYGLLPE